MNNNQVKGTELIFRGFCKLDRRAKSKINSESLDRCVSSSLVSVLKIKGDLLYLHSFIWALVCLQSENIASVRFVIKP